MTTFLFNEIIFGPVHSRRLGKSLGINLLPINKKICNFNCIYCECGLTPDTDDYRSGLPSPEEIEKKLIEKLNFLKDNNQKIDTITYAGNGEPTLHPDFPEIIERSVEIRNTCYPNARIAVLSNGSLVHNEKIFQALKKADQNILKLDSLFIDTVLSLNCPKGKYDLKKIIRRYKEFGKSVIIQTLFIKGMYNNKIIDNTTDKEVNAWLKVIKDIDPEMVMVYTIERDTPNSDLEKIDHMKLREIANKVEKLGIKTQISD